MSTNRYELERKDGGAGRSPAKLLYVTTAKYGGDWHSMPHTHACAELFYVVGGLGQLQIEGQLHAVQADDLVIVNPNVVHTELSLNANPLEYIVLGVEGLELSVSDEQDGHYCIVNFRGGTEDMVFLLRSMLREIEAKRPGYEIICQDLLDILIMRLKRRTNFSATLAPAEHRATKECAAARRYIDAHFKENITLDLLAQETHVNKYHLVHAFTREYGISPISYVVSCRIRESRYLLSETDHSLSQISRLLGFSSPSYFSQSFRRAEGVSPLEYRRREGRRRA